MIKNTIITLIIFLLFNCNSEKMMLTELTEIETYSFRRNYFGHDTLQGVVLDAFMTRNPIGIVEENEFSNLLKNNGLIKNDALNLEEFKILPHNFQYHISKEKEIQVEVKYFESTTTQSLGYILTFKDKGRSIIKDTLAFNFPPDVLFAINDVNKDGKDELYIVHQWYQTNGDNFDLTIYELK